MTKNKKMTENRHHLQSREDTELVDRLTREVGIARAVVGKIEEVATVLDLRLSRCAIYDDPDTLEDVTRTVNSLLKIWVEFTSMSEALD